MFLNTLYYGLSYIGLIVAVFVSTAFIAVVIEKVFDIEVNATDPLVIIILSVSLLGPYFIMSLGFDYRPPFLEAPAIEATGIAAVDENLARFKRQAQFLEDTLANFDQLKIGELKSVLEESLRYVQGIRDEAVGQEKLLSDLRQSRSAEEKRAEEATNLAEAAESIKQIQLEAVKLIINENAARESRRFVYWGVAVSFPVGVLASLSATYMRRKKIWGVPAHPREHC